MAALPLLLGIPVTLRGWKPEVRALEEDTLGAQLRCRRRELGLRRIDVACLLGCDEKSLMWWERGARKPFVFVLSSDHTVSWTGAVAQAHDLAWAAQGGAPQAGLSIEDAARVIGVDEGTHGLWESGVWKPQSRSIPLIERFLAGASLVIKTALRGRSRSAPTKPTGGERLAE
jgi:DNA-binding transcriptional regulator YiaG